MAADRAGHLARIAFEAARIPPERWGKVRLKLLGSGERALYEWILQRFAAGAAPEPDALADAASRFDVDVEETLATFAREDLVHHDPATGSILVAYPFSGRPTAHRVRFDGRETYAMCAIDALGVAPMLGLPIEVRSTDPTSGDEIEVSVAPDGAAWWRPEEAVVLAGSAREGPSFSSCCQVLNFFASQANADLYLSQRPAVSGLPVSIPEAIELGRLVFGDLLSQR